ncbi:MAG: DUF4358 domain-containing protein [Ruminococcus sp.]|nr:DUF4358 domain-containing protein [Ruminococcus sp.]
MKRILTLTIAIIMSLCVFVGCDSDSANSSSNVDLSKVLSDINENGELSSMKVISNTADLQKQFDVNPDDVSEYIAEVSEDGDFPTTVVVTKAAEDDKVSSIEDKLNSYLADKLSNAQSYNKDQVSTIEDCQVKTNGLYTMLVIAENHTDLEKIIENYFK